MHIPPIGETARILDEYGVSVSAELYAKIEIYTRSLLFWNQRIALTAITEPRMIVRRHFGESFFAAAIENLSHGRLADVGSGAGFPGLALKLLCPALEVTLIESNGKKAAFLSEVIRKLELTNVGVFRGRAENFEQSGGSLDFTTFRAVGDHASLLSWSMTRLKESGKAIFWLGREDSVRLSAVPKWQWHRPMLVPGSKEAYLLIGTPQR